jgi:hypothetical protein
MFSTLLCLGVGQVASSPAAQAQLGFFLALCAYAKADFSKCYVYDPVLNAAERWMLTQHFGFKLPSTNAEGDYSVKELSNGDTSDRPALFFLPHCNAGLASNCMRANWNSLKDLVLIGNSAVKTLDLFYFPAVDAKTLSKDPYPSDNTDVSVDIPSPNTLASLAPQKNEYLSSLHHTQDTTGNPWVGVARAWPWTVEHDLPSYDVLAAFNDMSIHSFTSIPDQVLACKPPRYCVPVQMDGDKVLTANPEIIPALLRPS